MYLCEAEEGKGLYWATANLANLDYTNEFTEGLHSLFFFCRITADLYRPVII